MNETRIDPCPHCGAPAILEDAPEVGHVVTCTHCYSTGPLVCGFGSSLTLAVECWNRRANTKPDTARLDYLQAECAGNVRGTDYPQWRIQGDYDQTIRDAIDKAMAK